MRLAIVPAGSSSASPIVAVALVPGEEAVEDLLAVLGQAGQRLVDVEGLLDLGEHIVRGDLRRGLARPPARSRPPERRRSMQSRRVSWPIHGRTASSSRRSSSFS